MLLYKASGLFYELYFDFIHLCDSGIIVIFLTWLIVLIQICKSIKTYLRILELLWWYIQQNNRHIFCHIKPLCFINTVRIMKWWKQLNMLIPQTKCLQSTVSQILTIKHKFSLQAKLATTRITPLCIPVPQVSICIIY